MNRLNNKGQAVMTDLMFGVLIFFMAFAILSAVWLNNSKVAVDERNFQQLEAKAFQASEFLVKTQGIPYNWQGQLIDDVNAIGLARKDRTLDERKVEKLRELADDWNSGGINYARLKEILNVEGFEFYFKVLDYNAGFQDSENYNSITVQRFIVLNGVVEEFEFKLFKRR